MAENKAKHLVSSFQGMNQLPVLRQVGLLIGLAASVALGVAIVLWSQSPNYRLLYSNLADNDTAEITDALAKANIPYQLSGDSSSVMVASDKLHDARLALASKGLPKSSGVGFESLSGDQGFGVSQFMENARYQRALEGELAKTISSLSSIQSARVHLAVPKESIFLRDKEKKKSSASVMISLHPGRTLEEEQVAAIVHLVSSSVPNLETEQVTVVDQKGRLLTSATSQDMKLTSSQFDFRKKVEDYYIKRIESILSPIIGSSGVRAQVTAEIDQSISEQTQESFNPDQPAIRSEQTLEEQTAVPGGQQPSGVPGAVTNQPPVAGTINKDAANAAGKSEQNQAAPQNSVRKATRNYELDRTISHVRQDGGNVKRLSVAVVLDDKQNVAEDGTVTREPIAEAELARLTELVKEAIGYNEQRGDKVSIINVAFTVPPAPEPVPEPGLLEKPWIGGVAKQVVAGIGILLLAFGVLRPVLRSLAEKGVNTQNMMVQSQEYGAPAGMAGAGMAGMPEDQLNLSAGQMQGRLTGPGHYDQQLNAAKTMVSQDSRRVAQVVKNWVATDGG